MAKDEEEDLLPDKDAAKGFYARYEPKEVLGRWEKEEVWIFCGNCESIDYLHELFGAIVTSPTV